LPDFPSIHPSDLRVILIEAGKRILMAFEESLATKAERVLKDLGVDVRLNSRVTDVNEAGVYAGGEFIENGQCDLGGRK
jgi:NADH dehydrogenase